MSGRLRIKGPVRSVMPAEIRTSVRPSAGSEAEGMPLHYGGNSEFGVWVGAWAGALGGIQGAAESALREWGRRDRGIR